MRLLARQIRVLQVHSDLVGGGIQGVLIELSRGLSPVGYAKGLCYFVAGHPDPPDSLLGELKAAGVKLYRLPVSHPFLSRYAVLLREAILDFEPDIVHLHAATVGVVGAVVCQSTRTPVVVYTDHVLHTENPGWVRTLRRLTDKYIDWEVCVSDQALDSLVGGIPPRSKRVSVIYNGVRLPEPLGESDRARARSELGLRPSDLVIGTLGRLARIKGYDYLVRAFPHILKEWPDSVLVLAGSGEQEADLARLAATCGVAAHVRFIGHRDDVARVLGSYDIYVQPSLTEALSLALLEAAGAQKPIVATRVGGNPEVIKDGVSGLLVPPRDSKALAEAVCELAGDHGRRAQYGRAARSRATSAFTAELMLANYDQLYRSLMDGRGSANSLRGAVGHRES